MSKAQETIVCAWHYGNDRHSSTLPRAVWEDWLQGQITRCAAPDTPARVLRARFIGVLADLQTMGRGEWSWYTFTIEGKGQEK